MNLSIMPMTSSSSARAARAFARRSALSHVPGTKVPVLLTVAEFDPVSLATPAFEKGPASGAGL
jgi:hypothetical protein